MFGSFRVWFDKISSTERLSALVILPALPSRQLENIVLVHYREVKENMKDCMGVPLLMEPNFSDYSCQDKDGYHWLTGRVDDVINVSGHRIGTAEVESAIVSHPQCTEAAVVGVEHELPTSVLSSNYAKVLTAGLPFASSGQRVCHFEVTGQVIVDVVINSTSLQTAARSVSQQQKQCSRSNRSSVAEAG